MHECEHWPGRLSSEGYPVRVVGRRDVYVHREVYERNVGPIREGHHVHHECGRKDCVEPSHLRAIPHAEHTSTHFRCRKHPEAARRLWGGIDVCAECSRERQRRWNEKNRERKNAHNRAYRARRRALARGEGE